MVKNVFSLLLEIKKSIHSVHLFVVLFMLALTHEPDCHQPSARPTQTRARP